MSHTSDYFDKQKPHSKIKTRIVSKYFPTWARIVGRGASKLTYLDLFSGRGYYKDGTPSTPIIILGAAKNIGDQRIRNKLQIKFYEKNRSYLKELREAVEAHPAYDLLPNKPTVTPKKITRENVPDLTIDDFTFCFIDPYGYKGASLDLLNSVIENWGSDCLFFLSVAGIRRNLPLEKQQPDLIALLGKDGLEMLHEHVNSTRKKQHFHSLLSQVLESAIRMRRKGRKTFFLPYAVDADEKQRVSHFLVFLTEHPKGFEVMKGIMALESPSDWEDIPLYCSRSLPQLELGLFSRINTLKDFMIKKYAITSQLVSQLVSDSHDRGELFLDRNIKQAIRELCAEEKVTLKMSTGKPQRQGQMGDKNTITFPEI